jgi:hypothetical protein
MFNLFDFMEISEPVNSDSRLVRGLEYVAERVLYVTARGILTPFSILTNAIDDLYGKTIGRTEEPSVFFPPYHQEHRHSAQIKI